MNVLGLPCRHFPDFLNSYLFMYAALWSSSAPRFSLVAARGPAPLVVPCGLLTAVGRLGSGTQAQ